MVERASARSCKMIFFPEFFDFVPRDPQENISLASEENGPFMERFRSLAKQHGIWMSLGGFHNKDPSGSLPWNSHIIIDNEGNTRALYNKLHLFDVDIPGKVRFMESELSRGGIKMVPPVATPIGRIGLGVCHDLRFAELALWNRYKGAEILCYPSAFTLYNGIAHFEVSNGFLSGFQQSEAYVVWLQGELHENSNSMLGFTVV
ncbi:hydrolase, carbon-nitrogen family [Cooperia oncophora]